MKVKIKEVFYCDHCNKHYFRQYDCKRHEKQCSKNPENKRLCFSCENICKKKYRKEECCGGESYYFDYELLFCDKIDSFIYPPQVEIKGNAIEVDSNVPMKNECEYYVCGCYENRDIEDIEHEVPQEFKDFFKSLE